jgi:cytochrome P450
MILSMTLPPSLRSSTLVQTARWLRRPLELLEEGGRRFGDLFTLRLASLGDVVMVSSPALIKQVFTADPAVLRAGQANELLRPILGRYSVLLLDGTEHVRQRRLLMPPFVGERMAVYAQTMQKSTLAALRSFPVGRPFRLHPAMQEITLDVILHAIFGLDDGPTLRRFAELLLDLFHDPPSYLFLLPPLRIDAPLSPYRRFVRARTVVDRAIYQLIDERRHAPDLAARSDILSLLLSARDEVGQPMSDEEVHDELMTIMAAGHETSATALAWTFERLLSEPSALARAVAEVREVQDVGPASLARLEYVDAIVKEALRLRPIIPVVGRTAATPLAFAGYDLPAGTLVCPCIHLVQRRADIYPEPERFRPERWLGVKVDPYAWLPFGGGIRRCIGMSFALYEIRLIVATVLLHARLRPASPAPERPVRRTVTMSPSKGASVVLTAPLMS